MQALSGTQIIYRAATGIYKPVKEVEQVCRMCGGPLLTPSMPSKKRSDTWTDENLCLRRDSEHLCAGCAWFIEGSNRINFWQGQKVVFASEEKRMFKALPVESLIDFLRTDFPLPGVILLRGQDPQLVRKHQQWRTMQGVTYDREKTKILFTGVQQFKGAKLGGSIEINVDRFIEQVEEMADVAVEFIVPSLRRVKSDWARQHGIFQQLCQGGAEFSGPELYLAAWLAAMETQAIIGRESEDA